MLPRRSVVVRYLMCMSLSLLVVVFWLSGPNDTVGAWLRYLEYGELNETVLRQEFEVLKKELNATLEVRFKP